MNRDFFIKLTLGTYRVTDVLPSQGQEKEEIRSLANSILADLILFSENSPIASEQKSSLISKIQGEIGSLVGYVASLKNNSKINPKHLFILEREYRKISQWLQEQSLAIVQSIQTKPGVSKQEKVKEESPLSERQKRILGILQNKEKTQVWELQKVLTEVTKRTLRRDLDDLLRHNLIERKGEWNAVFYRMKQ